MIKKISIFICCCFYTMFAYALSSYPVDTVALEEALKEITRVGNSTDTEIIENAQADLYIFFMKNSDQQIPVGDIVGQCVKIVQNNSSCMKFLQTYGKYLDHANFCLKANIDRIMPSEGTPGLENTKKLSFQECVSLSSERKYHEKDGTTSNLAYGGNSALGKCTDWVDAAEKCQSYLTNYYLQKLSGSNISKSDKKYYECLLKKVQTGNMDFPLSKMEEACK